MNWLQLLLAACSTSPAPFDDRVTPSITAGVYGQLTQPSDTGGATHAVEGLTVTASVDGQRIASAISDDRGVFELQLAPATYVLQAGDCVPSSYQGSCTLEVTVEATPVREDWTRGVLGGIWTDG